jgi:nicotinamide riboside transporter PnuC
MPESKLITYAFCGFSLAQIFGLLFLGYGFYQSLILYLIFCFISSIPGFVRYGIMQRETASELQSHHIKSCFIPTFIAICVLSTGFLLGCFVAN